MSKKATLLYLDKVTVAGALVPAKALGAVSISAGKMKTVRLKLAQNEGWVNELVVKQKSGTGIAYVVELCDSKVPYYLGSDGSQERAYTAVPDVTIDLFRVLPQQTAVSGAAVFLQRTDYGYPFINNDGPSQTDADKYLYLTIVPTNAAGGTVWEVSFTYSRDITA